MAQPRLLDLFSQTLSFGLDLDERIAKGAVEEQASELQQSLRDLLNQAHSRCLAAGKLPDQVERAAFAVAAWLDEVLTRNPNWWHTVTPLQVTLFNTNNAGNEFFDKLSSLRSEEDELRELYYHVLLLGFVGQYYYETGEQGELAKLKELHARQLPLAPVALHSLGEEGITAQPYLEKDPAGPRYPRQWDQLLLKGAALLALLIPLAYLGWLLLATPEERGPTLAERVERQLQAYKCADLTAQVDQDGTTRVSGYLPRSEDVARLSQEVQALDGVKQATFDLAVHIWPHCEAAALLKPWRERNQAEHRGLSVTPRAGHAALFSEGERVIVKLHQADFDGYLYVDYYTVDGQVIHLFPNRREPDSGRLIDSGEMFTVGERIAEGWEVGPPFGQEMISVIAVDKPLYPAERAEVEPASDYLPYLRGLLEARRDDANLLSDYLFLQTEAKR
ncbi:DotU/TssL family secretion system protein [Pseudomonas putida]